MQSEGCYWAAVCFDESMCGKITLQFNHQAYTALYHAANKSLVSMRSPNRLVEALRCLPVCEQVQSCALSMAGSLLLEDGRAVLLQEWH